MRYKTGARWRRAIRHQHEIEPIQAFVTVKIQSEYDMAKLRKNMSRSAQQPYVGFIEQAKRGKPHFHLLFKTDQTKRDIRAYFQKCLPVNTKYRVCIRPIYDIGGLARYLTKYTQPYTAGRSVFEVKTFWSQKTSELQRQTEEERRRQVWRMYQKEQDLILCTMYGLVSYDQMMKPGFASYWKRVLSKDPHLMSCLELELNNCWGEL